MINIIGQILELHPAYDCDCVENYQKPGEFSFYDGNEMEGHVLLLIIQAPNLNVEPSWDLNKDIWVWKKVSKKVLYHRKWWADRR